MHCKAKEPTLNKFIVAKRTQDICLISREHVAYLGSKQQHINTETPRLVDEELRMDDAPNDGNFEQAAW